jgi:hypothetical protein
MAERLLNQVRRPVSRREWLHRVGMGFGGVALAQLAATEGAAASRAALGLSTHLPAKAKHVIWIFLAGGLSHMESFDPKPALNTYAGKSISETPFADVLKNPNVAMNLEKGFDRKMMQSLYPLQVGYQKRGESGIEVSDWWPHVGQAIDEIAVVRSMWTTDNNHQAQYQFHTGRNIVQGNFPSIGSWVHYGLGSLNENLPRFIVMGEPLGNCCGGSLGHGADYLGPQHAGVRINTDSDRPLEFVSPPAGVSAAQLLEERQLVHLLNQDSLEQFPDDPVTEARIRAYELAYRMQVAVPEIASLSGETANTLSMYGLDREDGAAQSFSRQCLLARRFVEQGVRFVQILHGAGGAGAWDAHAELKQNYSRLCHQVDQPIAALIADLKQRGLLDETLVVVGTEFGRTPGLEVMEGSNNREGRDHHPYAFSVCLAGGGVKGGVVHGATDELGFHAIEHRHYVTDIHATVMHQLGLDPERLDPPGRKRLEKDYGHPIFEILS